MTQYGSMFDECDSACPLSPLRDLLAKPNFADSIRDDVSSSSPEQEVRTRDGVCGGRPLAVELERVMDVSEQPATFSEDELVSNVKPEVIQKNLRKVKDELIRLMEPNFDLVSALYSVDALTLNEKDKIISKKTTHDKNTKLVKYMLRKKESVLKSFLQALWSTEQRHIVNYILGNARDPDERPLNSEELAQLRKNAHYLESNIDADELTMSLFSSQAISLVQREHIQCQPTSSLRARELVDILTRRSLADLKTFVSALRSTGQSHIAEVLEQRGVVMTTRAHIRNFAAETVAPMDTDIVSRVRQLLSSTDCTPEQLEQLDVLLQLKRQGIDLVGAATGSVQMFFWCRSEAGLNRLHEWLVNGRVRDIVKTLFNKLMGCEKQRLPGGAERIIIDLDWNEEEYDACMKHLIRFPPPAVAGSKRGLSSMATSTEADEGPAAKVTRRDGGTGLTERRSALDATDGQPEMQGNADSEPRFEEIPPLDNSDINQLPDLVREMFLLRSVVILFRSLNREMIRPEPDVYRTLAGVSFHWWTTINGRVGYTRTLRRALNRTCIPYRRHWKRLARLSSRTPGSRVRGVAHLDGRIYVIYSRGSDGIGIYEDREPFSPAESIPIDGVRFPLDVAASASKHCLYMADWAGGGERGGGIWQISPDSGEAWKTLEDIDKPRKLSLTDDRLLVVSGNSLVTYSLAGELPEQVKVVELPEGTEPQHAVETASGTYLVGHGESSDVPHRISEFLPDGTVLRTYGDDRRGRGPGQLSWPAHVCLGAGAVLLADCDNDRLLQFTDKLRLQRLLMTEEDHDIHTPRRLCYIADSGLLLVGIDFGFVDVYRIR